MPFKSLNQKGFAVIEAAIIIVVLIAIGGTGYYVYHHSHKKITNTAESSSKVATNSPAKTSEPTKPALAPAPSYLVIKEWGVKLMMADADKVTYQYDTSCYNPGGSCDSAVSLAVKPQYLQDKSCKVSVGIDRMTSFDSSQLKADAKKIGGHYYLGDGNPYNCGNSHDNDLNQKIRGEFNFSNLQPI